MPKVVLVALENGDAMLVVNGRTVATADVMFDNTDVAEIATNLAAALGVRLKRVALPVPPQEDWGWSDVLDVLRAMPD